MGLLDTIKAIFSGENIPQQIVQWAQANAATIGIDMRTLATSLLATSHYESGWTNQSNVLGIGPFSFDPRAPAYPDAISHGYDVTTVKGSLDYFMNRDFGWWNGINAIIAGDPHGFERFVERPDASVDAERVARGDFQTSYDAARAFLGSTVNKTGGSYQSTVANTQEAIALGDVYHPGGMTGGGLSHMVPSGGGLTQLTPTEYISAPVGGLQGNYDIPSYQTPMPIASSSPPNLGEYISVRTAPTSPSEYVRG